MNAGGDVSKLNPDSHHSKVKVGIKSFDLLFKSFYMYKKSNND